MPDDDRAKPRETRSPPGTPPPTWPPSLDVAAALGGLDRASTNLSRLSGLLGKTEGRPAAEPPRPTDPVLEARMVQAEREAREYLERSKRRVDSLLETMIGAVEKQAIEMRRDAEASIRARWTQVEVDANRQIEEARQMGDRLVANRQARISSLSDGISSRADALTVGMEDAAKVRDQFDTFVRALSVAADRIAERQPAASRGELHDLRPQPNAVAA